MFVMCKRIQMARNPIKHTHVYMGGGDTGSGRWEIRGKQMWEVGDGKTMWEVGDWDIKCGRCDLRVYKYR